MTKVHLCRFLYFCGILAPPTIIIIILIAGQLTPGYNPLADSISTLSGQESLKPELMTIGFIAFGSLMIGFSYGLHMGMEHGLKARIVWITFTIYGLGMISAGVFQDSPGIASGTINAEGVLHNVFTATSFFSLLIGVWVYARSVHRRPSWFGFTWFTLVASAVSLTLSIIFILRAYVPYPGLIQRVFYIIPLIWIETVSIWLFRLSFKSDG